VSVSLGKEGENETEAKIKLSITRGRRWLKPRLKFYATKVKSATKMEKQRPGLCDAGRRGCDKLGTTDGTATPCLSFWIARIASKKGIAVGTRLVPAFSDQVK